MGINLTWVCHTHKKKHTSLRGEEDEDFQDMVRGPRSCPSDCLRHGRITVYHDGYANFPDYEEMYSEWGHRPVEQRKAREALNG